METQRSQRRWDKYETVTFITIHLAVVSGLVLLICQVDTDSVLRKQPLVNRARKRWSLGDMTFSL